MRPVIGIAGNVDESRLGVAINALPLAYVAAIEQAGGLPLVLPFCRDQSLLALMLTRVDGLLLPGGIDLDPDWYAETPAVGLEEVRRDLDVFQLALFHICLAEKKPVLGICRGCQVIDVALGGSLFQDIDNQWPSPPLRHRGVGHDTEHPVSIVPDSRLSALFGPEVIVNSRHHQAVKIAGRDLRVTAVGPDGVIEAAEHSSLPIHLVQWHPERMLAGNALMLPLFQEFIDQCRSR